MDKEKHNTPSNTEKEESVSSSEEHLSKLPEVGSPERIAAEKALLRKLDMRLMPTLFIIIIMNYIDVCSGFLKLSPFLTNFIEAQRRHGGSITGATERSQYYW